MKYISGIHALNLPCKLETTGDWHTSALNWADIREKESDDSVFGDYGIEIDRVIPEHGDRHNVANHIRAILDLMQEHNFALISNFNHEYICNNRYTSEIFEKTMLLLPDAEIDRFMLKTYGRKWSKWTGEYSIRS